MILETTINIATAQAQPLTIEGIKDYEHRLEDIMELTDTNLVKIKLVETEEQWKREDNEINKARLGIIYHETALNLSFFSQTNYKGYAQKSFDILSELLFAPNTSIGLLPFIASYRASAMSLVGAETKKLKPLGDAFALFEEADLKYGAVSYLPQFLRGSVAENLPWFFFVKRKYAIRDFQSIVDKQNRQENYANWKIMSYTYYALANKCQSKKCREKSMLYLDKAIQLDPDYKAGRQKAEALKMRMKM